MSNVDFISGKWRTVRRTRRLGWFHLGLSIVPVIYVGIYAEAQRRAGDAKELGAALAALMFNLFQLLRTMMGITQLGAFIRWCKHAVECIRALLGADEEEDVNVADVADVHHKLKVNNSVVDNELGGIDTTVWPSRRKIWKALKQGDFWPSRWLKTYHARLSTVRWCGALLCGMGEYWTINKKHFRHHFRHYSISEVEVLSSFFSSSLADVRSILQFVTWNIGGQNTSFSELFSIGRLSKTYFTDLKEDMSTAYDTDIPVYNITEPVTAKSYKFEFDALVGSYPSNNDDYEPDNREKIVVELTHSVLLAKHLGVDKLKAIRKYYKNHRLPIPEMNRNAFEMLLKQHGKRISEDSGIWAMFNSGEIPIFPYRMQMVALWEEATNWQVLQASAQQDIFYSTSCHGFGTPILRRESRPASLFDLCAELASNEQFKIYQSNYFLGVVTESVRTFLAEYVAASSGEPNWEPEFSTDPFDFDVSEEVCNTLKDDNDSLLWVCQNRLQQEVARSMEAPENANLTANRLLIMLFLLGFPTLDMKNEASPVVDAMVHVNVLNRCVSTFLAPQNISVLIRVDSNPNAREVSLSLKNDSDDKCFKWQDWVDAIMGCMKGFEGRRGRKMSNRTIVRSDLRTPVLKLNPFRPNTVGRTEETNVARIWMGWPAFDMNICKFEVEQWLAACKIDLKSFHGSTISIPTHKQDAITEIERAKSVVEATIA